MDEDSLESIPTSFIQTLVDQVITAAKMEPCPAEMLAVEKILDDRFYQEESLRERECWDDLQKSVSIKDVDPDDLYLQCRTHRVFQEAQNESKARVRIEYISLKDKIPTGYGRVIIGLPTETLVTQDQIGQQSYEVLYKFLIMLPEKAAYEPALTELMKTVEGVFAHELFHLLYRKLPNDFRSKTRGSKDRKKIEENAADEFARQLIERRSG